MEPKKVGRALGIGVRVASKMVQQRVAAASEPQPSQNAARKSQPSPRPSSVAGAPAKSGQRVATAQRGLKAFWQAFMGPFTRAGSILWLEITGLFFALFTLFFVQSVYRVRGSWRSGPDHLHLLLYVVLAAGFGWFSASSFLGARRKSKQGPVTRARS